ncbi:unnamed protein product, partial [marine sediment metagenome]
ICSQQTAGAQFDAAKAASNHCHDLSQTARLEHGKDRSPRRSPGLSTV